MKKITALLLVLLLVGSFAFAEGDREIGGDVSGDSAPPPPPAYMIKTYNNWISGEISLLVRSDASGYIGACASYERMLDSRISLGANIFYSLDIEDYNYIAGAAVSFRFYPVSKVPVDWGLGFVFVGAGLGFFHEKQHYIGGYIVDQILVRDSSSSANGVAFIPEFGVKTDPGRPGAFFWQLGVQVPIMRLGEPIGGVYVGLGAKIVIGYAF